VLERHKDKPTGTGKPVHTLATGLGSQPMTMRPKEQDQEEGKKQRQICEHSERLCLARRR
jgi:hypothetical protein